MPFRRLEEKVDDRFGAVERTFDAKLDAIEYRWNNCLGEMEARLTWRMVALVTFLGSVMTLVGRFLG